jgi:undecaprenyl-diphosphatase
MTVVRKLVLALAGSAVFALLTRKAARGTVSADEERAFRVVNQMSGSWRAPAWIVMQSGSLAAVPVVAVLAVRKNPPTAVALAIDGTAVWAGCKVVKRFTKRGRPADHLDGVVVRGTAQRGLGYPSGHAAVATTLATVGSRLLSPPMAIGAFATATLVGGAREYVGAHLPLDVVGGAALGASAGMLANVALDLRRAAAHSRRSIRCR